MILYTSSVYNISDDAIFNKKSNYDHVANSNQHYEASKIESRERRLKFKTEQT